MAVTQMSGLTVLAAPEGEQSGTETETAEYDGSELVHGVSVTAVGDTIITPHFNEAFTLKVQVTKDDSGSYTYEWYKDFVANMNKLNNNTDTLTVEEGISVKKQAYFFCVFESGNPIPVSQITFTVTPTNDLDAHIKGEPNNRSTDMTLPYGSSVTLSVEASAHDESNMMYTWCNRSIRNLSSGEKAWDYTIDSVTKNDTYTCLVQDGLSTSGVNVDFHISIDNKFVAYPEGESEDATTRIITAPVGTEETLKVIASCADDSLGFAWGSKGARQSAYTTVIGATSDTLDVKVANEDKYYRCSVYDQFLNNKQIVFIVKPGSDEPTGTPTEAPTGTPTEAPTGTPTEAPTGTPTEAPTGTPTEAPTGTPTEAPTGTPTEAPTGTPTEAPTGTPTEAPTVTPTVAPTPTQSENPSVDAPTLDEYVNGVSCDDYPGHIIKAEKNADGSLKTVKVYFADGQTVDTSINHLLINMKLTDKNGKSDIYTLAFTNGEWDVKYDSKDAGAYSYRNESYMVAGGVVNQNANGLQYTGEAAGWKFLAAGRVVKDNAGLVMYNGEWFWIDNTGSCDQDYAAIAYWNGAKFLVHGGRLRTDYTGFTYDPQDKNVWYHITNGQVWGDGEITDQSIEGGMITRNVVNGVVQ